MAYYNQKRKQEVAPRIRKLLKDYGLKGSLSVKHYSTVVLTLRSGKIDFIKQLNNKGLERGETQIKTNLNVNHYHLEDTFSGNALEFLIKAKAILMEGNHNNSNAMIDYFDVGWYMDINIGKWDKYYQVTKQKGF